MKEVLATATAAMTLQYINVSHQHIAHLTECYMSNIVQKNRQKVIISLLGR